MNTRNPVGWFEIYVNDIQRAQIFYETVLKVKLENLVSPESLKQNMKMMAFPGDPYIAGSSGSLVQMEGCKAGGNSTLVYFSCENCANEESRVSDAGGNIFKSKMSIGEYGYISLCTDTEGNMFGLHSME